MSINFTNVYLEDGDRGADDEDEDVRHGEVDEEHVDHSLEAGACGHWQDDLNNRKYQRAWRMTLIEHDQHWSRHDYQEDER